VLILFKLLFNLVYVLFILSTSETKVMTHDKYVLEHDQYEAWLNNVVTQILYPLRIRNVISEVNKC